VLYFGIKVTGEVIKKCL